MHLLVFLLHRRQSSDRTVSDNTVAAVRTAAGTPELSVIASGHKGEKDKPL